MDTAIYHYNKLKICGYFIFRNLILNGKTQKVGPRCPDFWWEQRPETRDPFHWWHQGL